MVLAFPRLPVDAVERCLRAAGGEAHCHAPKPARAWPGAGYWHPQQNRELLLTNTWSGQSCISTPHLLVLPPSVPTPTLARVTPTSKHCSSWGYVPLAPPRDWEVYV